MTLRGVYKSGVIVLSGSAELSEGTQVEVRPVRTETKKRAAGRKKKISARPKTPKKKPYGFGIWRDRTDLGRDTLDVAATLRKRVMRRAGHG